MISVFCWEVMVTTAIAVVVIERAIAVGFREKQLWPLFPVEVPSMIPMIPMIPET